MDGQRFFIQGRTYGETDPLLQEALARVYDSAERPRCMCVQGGVEMYVAHHRLFVTKRMPGSGTQHHPTCSSYESEPQQSGLGELLGEAIIEHSPESVELRVDFPLARTCGPGRRVAAIEPGDPSEVTATRRRMSLRALMHFLFERAGFNRWTPAMEGKRNQGVLHKYLTEAADDVITKGLPLSERLYVPEPFSEATQAQTAKRRREKLAILHTEQESAQFKMALVVGEYKGSESTAYGRRILIKHMPDSPLLADSKTWGRIERVYGALFESCDADIASKPRIMMAALVYARREHTYQIDTASLMLTTEQWIPLNAIYEIDLIRALIEHKRRFIKPLQYDAPSAAGFPNVLLLDVGDKPVPLHVLSAYANTRERTAKEKAIKAATNTQWIWSTDHPMPALPPVFKSRLSSKPPASTFRPGPTPNGP